MGEMPKMIVPGPEPTTAECLYRLPNGDLVRPSEIRSVVAYPGIHQTSSSVMVWLRGSPPTDPGNYIEIGCATGEEACEIRDRIGRDLAAPAFINAEASRS